jgi:hypothetical protein
MNDRDRLKITFDSAAQLYQRARPEYPSELYDELVGLAELRPGDRLLEVGCATGRPTLSHGRGHWFKSSKAHAIFRNLVHRSESPGEPGYCGFAQ